MRHTPLPFIQALETLAETNPAEALAQRDAAAKALVACDGFQFILSLLQTLEKDAMTGITAGLAVERNVGRLAAVKAIRDSLRALLPVAAGVDASEMIEEELLPPYASGFSVPV